MITVRVAHDFTCPWCWIGVQQAERLRRDFGVTIEWSGYELYPDELEWPEARPSRELDARRPLTLSRLQMLLAADGMGPIPNRPPSRTRTHRAHEAVEFAKRRGDVQGLVRRIYDAAWVEGAAIADLDVVVELAKPFVEDAVELRKAIEERRFAGDIVGFDDPAYASGVFNVPTFFIGDERYAERPYRDLSAAVRRELGDRIVGAWPSLEFESAPQDRPTTVVNMVSTIDGKIITGERDEPVHDLGSDVDHATMRQIQAHAQAVMVGAESVRATPKIHYPEHVLRLAVTASGRLDPEHRFFQTGEGIALTTEVAQTPERLPTQRFGVERFDFRAALRWLREERDVRVLLVEGGSELNAALMKLDLIDEIFLTFAPKIKLGREVPTIAGGDPLARSAVQGYRLIEHRRIDDELFLRYRRRR